MDITVLTLFPAMFEGPFRESMVKRAVDRGLVRLHIRNIRDWAHDKHQVVDDAPFGGGPGMVMKPEFLFEAVEAARSLVESGPAHVVLLTPQGRVFNQALARELSQKKHVVLVCGHYEGMDERVHEHLADDEISIGDYVLTGGEPAAIVIVDAVTRLLPGVLGDPESASDSFSSGLLQYPQYTRPKVFRGWEPPEVLLSGNHQEIARWRRMKSIQRTLQRRPELIEDAGVTAKELEAVKRELEVGVAVPEGHEGILKQTSQEAAMAAKNKKRTVEAPREALAAFRALIESPTTRRALERELAEDAPYLVPPREMLENADRELGSRTLTGELNAMRDG